MSELIRSNLPCDKCGSSDAVAEYTDGFYCFSCNTHTPKGEHEEVTEQEKQMIAPPPTIDTLGPADIPIRGLNRDTVEHFGVRVEFNTGTGEVAKYYYPVYKGGKQTGWKWKDPNQKAFGTFGETNKPQLFGQRQVGDGSKLLIVTEGEDDAMASYQLLRQFGKNYAVVSLPNGANTAAIKANLEWLEGFTTIMLLFDNDDKGADNAKAVADILTPGKVKICPAFPEEMKDANEYLLKSGDPRFFVNEIIYKAKTYSPDGIVALQDSWEALWESESTESIPYPWEGMNSLLYGLRPREIVTLTAGSGMGKSAVTRELEHWLLRHTEDNIGILALEENVARTAWGVMSVEASLPLSIREERKGVSREDIRKWFDATMGTGRLFTFDHFGSTSEDNLLSKVRYMVKGLDCKWIILDHLSIVVSAMDEGGDERRTIDSIMTKLRQLTEETGAGLILVSHLRRVGGDKGHEQGHEVSLAHLRGSQSISHLSDAVIALERNQQADDPKEANITRVRVLKNRYAGLTGIATHLYYERETGRLTELPGTVEEFLAPTTEETGGF